MQQQILLAMQQSIADGMPDHAAELAKRTVLLGIDPLIAINDGFVPGMNQVGEKYSCGQMFLPDLMASSEAMRAAMAVLEPELKKQGIQQPTLGTVVLGTTQGDIHEIGKALVGTLLVANGFQVYDLGPNVPIDRFIAKAQEAGADIIGVSALLTTTMLGQKKVVEAPELAGLRGRVKIMVGGAPVSRKWAEEIGADGYGSNAMNAVALAKSWVQK
jgi:corrinoid protein of di/trimethylamine methyltransferase